MFGSNYFGQAYFGQGYPVTGILFDNASNSGYQASLSTYSWTHKTGLSLRGLIVNVSIFATGQVTSITYGGVAMTFVRADTSGVYRNEIWKLENPAYGSNTVTVNLSASVTSIASAVSYGNVDQTSMIDANTGGTGVGAGTPSVTISTISNYAWVVAGISTSNTGITPGTGQTLRSNKSGILGLNSISDDIQVISPSSVTMTWSSVNFNDSWAMSVVAINPFENNTLGTTTSTSSTSSSTSSTTTTTKIDIEFIPNINGTTYKPGLQGNQFSPKISGNQYKPKSSIWIRH